MLLQVLPYSARCYRKYYRRVPVQYPTASITESTRCYRIDYRIAPDTTLTHFKLQYLKHAVLPPVLPCSARRYRKYYRAVPDVTASIAAQYPRFRKY